MLGSNTLVHILSIYTSVQRDISLLFLVKLIWFKSYSIFILQTGYLVYFIMAIIDIGSDSTTDTLHYKLTIILSALWPPCTLTCSFYYIVKVGLPFVFPWLTLRFLDW